MDAILDAMNKNRDIKAIAIDEKNQIIKIERAMDSSFTSSGHLVDAVIYDDVVYDLEDDDDALKLLNLSLGENSELIKETVNHNLAGGESLQEITNTILSVMKDEKFIDLILRKSIREVIVLTRLYSEKSLLGK